VMPAYDPVRRLELLIRLSLWGISFFGIIVAIFLAATVVPDDRTDGTITTVLTKPVGRLNYILGRVLGFAMTLGLILVVMGALSLGFIRWASHAAGEATGRRDLLAAKRGLDPTSVHRLEPGRQLTLRDDAEYAVLSGPKEVELVYAFRTGLDRLSDTDNQTLEILPVVATGMALPQVDAEITVTSGVDRLDNVSVICTLNSRRLTTVHFPSRLVHPVEGVHVVLRRTSPQYLIRLRRDACRVMIAPLPFEWGYLKSLAVVYLGFLLVVVIAITSSTFLSSWVAVLLAFSAYFFAAFQEALLDFMKTLKLSLEGKAAGLLGTGAFEAIHGHHHGPVVLEPDPWWVQALNHVMWGCMWVLTHIFPDFNTFDASPWVTQSQDVPWTVMGWAALVLVCYGTCYLVVGHLLFWRRELVP
ncbi:MAG TPA: ABC transporter permease, partial [Planctomycetota bacterium]|nr:ABC transporter permease [Planctomycetota bacterium]